MEVAKRHELGEDLVALAFSCFLGVCAFAWLGRLGLAAVGLLLVSMVGRGNLQVFHHLHLFY